MVEVERQQIRGRRKMKEEERWRRGGKGEVRSIMTLEAPPITAEGMVLGGFSW